MSRSRLDRWWETPSPLDRKVAEVAKSAAYALASRGCLGDEQAWYESGQLMALAKHIMDEE